MAHNIASPSTMGKFSPSSISMATAVQNELEIPTNKAAGRCLLVLFGASGDLTRRKLVPALLNLAKAGLLPKNYAILGVAFDDLTVEQFRERLTSFLSSDTSPEALNFKQRLF